MLVVTAGNASEQGVLIRRYDYILKPLLTLAAIAEQAIEGGCLRRTIFQTGNHDIGITGLRYVRSEMPDFLPRVPVAWNPGIYLEGGAAPDSSYSNHCYIEHGHHYDPFLWLYMRYALLDLLRGGHLGREAQFIRGMQRGGRRGMGRHSHNTPPKPTDPPSAALSKEPDPTEAPEPGAANWHFGDVQHTFAELLVIYRYRQAARRAFRALRRRHRKRWERTGKDAPLVRTVIFGHTHLPDRYVFPNGFVYINSGDWCGNTPHQCYSIIQSDGTVRGPFQWNDASRREFGALPNKAT